MSNNLKTDSNTAASGKVWWVVAGFIVFFTGIVVYVGCHTDASKDSMPSIYMPAKDNSVISKTNDLLAHLVENGNRAVRVRSIDDLNRKYPGLVFDTPDINVDVDYIRTTDIRLVDIKLKEIKDRTDRDFYNNSNLTDLLEKQRNNMGLAFFKIRMDKDESGYYTIKSIKVVPSVYRTRLDNKVSRSTILSNPNNLFPASNYCFVVWKDQVIPIKQFDNNESLSERAFSANVRNGYFYHLFSDAPLTLVDIDSLYRSLDGNVRVRINMGNNGYILVDYLQDGRLALKTGDRLICTAHETGRGPVTITPSTSSGDPEIFDFDKDIRIVFNRNEPRTEMVLTHNNPLTILASATRSNSGVSRYTISPSLTDYYTQQVVAGLEAMLPQYDYNDTVRLTLDPILARYIEKELKDYTRQLMRQPGLARGSWEASMTVMDMSTGEILAMPYYRSENDGLEPDVAFTRKNPALICRYPGSTFKPMIALASVLTCPDLLSLNTHGHYSINTGTGTALFYGSPTTAWAVKTPGHWNGRASLCPFLAYSCDVYPVALAALALNGGNRNIANINNGFFVARDGQIYINQDRTLAEQPLMRNLDILYDINSNSEEHDSAARMPYYLWRNLTSDTNRFSDDDLLALDLLSPDPVIMHYSKIARESLRSTFVTWVLGQGTNEWNCVKMAEAWCRMLSKRDLKASMVRRVDSVGQQQLITNELQGGANEVWNEFLSQFESAQHIAGGTVYPMWEVVANLNREDPQLREDPLVLFSKTGTPNNYVRKEFNNLRQDEMVLDVAMYTFGIMKNREYQNVQNGQPAKGVVCVLRFTRTVKKNDIGNQDGLWSTHARDFFSSHRYRFTNLYHLIEHYL